MKGDWDAEKVIDIPNKKVTLYLAIFVQNLILFVESDKIMFSFPFRNHAFYYKEALQNWNGSLPTTKGWQ